MRVLILVFMIAFTESFSKETKFKDKFYKKYLEISNSVCSEKTKAKHKELLKEYRKFNIYVPVWNKEIQVDVIKKHLPMVIQKKKWVENGVKTINEESLRKSLKLLEKIRVDFKRAKSLKKDIFLEKRYKKKNSLFMKERVEMRTLFNSFRNLMYSTPFYLNYSFPVDFTYLRSLYEKYGELGSKKKLDIFFYRKIVEDGAPHSKTGSPDRSFRMLANTLYFRLRSSKELTDDIIYDLRDFLSLYEGKVKLSVEEIKLRHKKWAKRIQKQVDFYQTLFDKKKAKTYGLEKVEKTRELRNFIIDLQKEIYFKWTKEEKKMRQVFSLVKILDLEVGPFDPHRVERYDIATVVKLRSELPEYSRLSRKQSLYEALYEKHSKKNSYWSQFNWLNALFRVGEFSFTYYYIPSSIELICAGEPGSQGDKLTKENIEIALEFLENKKASKQKALRYFSRASMPGRVDMARAWKDWVQLPMQIGPKAEKELTKDIFKGEYDVVDRFQDPNGRSYLVIEVDEKKRFNFDPVKREFFHYRNPYYFRYFAPGK